jgi:uncharacterized protein (TIGR03086 family)
MDLADMIERAANRAAEVIKGIGEGQLDNQTPCADWSVRQLGNHMTGFLGFSAGAARRHPPMGEGESPDFAGGDDWASTYASMAADLAAAWKEDGATDGNLMFGAGGEMKATDAAAVTISELVIHAWDLATATGQTYQADDDLAHLSLQVATGGQESGAQDFYGPPITANNDAPIFHKALAMSGRSPDWEHLGPTTQGH